MDISAPKASHPSTPSRSCAHWVDPTTKVHHPPAPLVANSRSATPASLTVSIDYLRCGENGVFRFMTSLANNSMTRLTGVRTLWCALNAAGALVGHHEARHPDLLPGQRVPYVGGASDLHLTARPASLTIDVTATPVEGTSLGCLPLEATSVVIDQVIEDWFDITATFHLDEPAARADDHLASLVLRNPDGSVNFADFTDEVLPLWVSHNGRQLTATFSVFTQLPPGITAEAHLRHA